MKFSASLCFVVFFLLSNPRLTTAQELGAADVVAKFKPFFGEWTAKHKFDNSPPGTARVIIAPAVSGNFVKFRWLFKPEGFGEMEIINIYAGLDGAEKKIRWWAALFDGNAAGEVEFEEHAATFSGGGVSFNGKKESRTIVYTVDGDELTWHQLGGMTDGKPLPEDKFVLKRGKASPDATTSSDELLNEVQGTWKLEQNGGQWTTKTITGNKSKLVRYRKDGTVRGGHDTEFELTDLGGVKIYRPMTTVATVGPNKGNSMGRGMGYVYTVKNDTWTEFQGAMNHSAGRVRVYEWKRVKDE